jgi:hypothetical protein
MAQLLDFRQVAGRPRAAQPQREALDVGIALDRHDRGTSVGCSGEARPRDHMDDVLRSSSCRRSTSGATSLWTAVYEFADGDYRCSASRRSLGARRRRRHRDRVRHRHPPSASPSRRRSRCPSNRSREEE